MRQLYVSDLDGTLLNSTGRLSMFTQKTLNQLITKGLLFSYATARSRASAVKVTKELNINIPVIVYNGAEIVQSGKWNIIEKYLFGKEKLELLNILVSHNVYPLVEKFIDGKERVSYIPEKSGSIMQSFSLDYGSNERNFPVKSSKDLIQGDVFYFSCIDKYEKLKPLYDMLRSRYHCVLHRDYYTSDLWLEITPEKATKAQAVQWLKEYMKADRIIVFGDGELDKEMFSVADESYAVGNADKRLAYMATGIIGSNDSDGVAKWLADRCRCGQYD